MDIQLTPASFNDRKVYVGSIYQAMTKLLAGQDITIKISHKIDLDQLVEALDNIEDIVHAAANTMRTNAEKTIDEEEADSEGPEDPADYWKNQ